MVLSGLRGSGGLEGLSADQQAPLVVEGQVHRVALGMSTTGKSSLMTNSRKRQCTKPLLPALQPALQAAVRYQ